MYIYISSDQSGSNFQGNSPGSFRVKLPRQLQLTPQGSWNVAILDINLPKPPADYKPAYLTINSSMCQPSFVNGTQAPVLHKIYYSQFKNGKPLTFDNPRYVPVITDSLDIIEIYLTDSNGALPTFEKGHSACTLHLVKAD